MDAGPRHSAVNFSRIDRVQLVARKLLNRSQLDNPVSLKVSYAGENKDAARFVFDDVFSPWLNKANKNKILPNFKYFNDVVQFDLEHQCLTDFESLIPNKFILEVI
jgi:hypothetical protein